MKRLINSLFGFFKYVLLVIAFGLTLFIILRMYTRLNKSLTESITYCKYLFKEKRSSSKYIF